MASRRRAREFALQALYTAELNDAGTNAGLQALWAGLLDGEGLEGARPAESEEIEFAQRIVFGVDEHRASIDEMIEQCSTNWRLSRMPVVDRNILRMAAFELMHCMDIPPNVSVNEAVELAKTFGTAESRAFVNGIVDRIGRHLNRLQPRKTPGG